LASTLPEAPPLKEVEGKISIHSGIVSGAAINELTSYIARQSDPVPERLKICINWLPEYRFQGILEYIQFVMNSAAEKTVFRTRLFNFPSKLWIRLVTAADIGQANRWKDLSPIQLQELASQLVDSHFVMRPDLRAVNISKYYGGVHLENIHPDRPECIRLPKVYLVGDILDKVSEDSTRNQAGITDHGLAWIRHIG